MLIIGLTGRAGAGKDTVADHLVEHYGFEKRAFAGPLKAMLRTLDPMIAAPDIRLHEAILDLDGDEVELKSYYPEYRRLLQVLGTECIRAIDPDFWVKAAMSQVTSLPANSRIVFTDVRFPNEAEAIRNVGGIAQRAVVRWDTALWEVSRPGPAVAQGHSSEEWAGRMNEDWVINNRGNLEYLRKQVDTLIRPHVLDGVAA